MRILCFGDFNTYGFDPRGPFGGRYSSADRWPERLAMDTRWEVINDGVNGRRIPTGKYQLPPEAGSVDLTVVMLGTNDLLQGLSPGETAERMENFLSLLCPCSGPVLLIAPPPLRRGAWVEGEELVEASRLLIPEYRKLADRRHIPFVDTGSWDIPLTFDGVHFTEAGHHCFADRLQKTIQKQIQEAQL